MARLDRFLRLEKRRPAAASQAPALGSPERFSPEPPPEERPLHVLQDDVMPFVRCCVCRADSHVSARVCPNCGSDLATPVQRAFNRTLAGDYERRSLEERAEAEQVRATQAQADREAREAQRRAIDDLLRMARRSGSPEPDPPIGLRLARRIRNPLLRLVALVSAGLVPLALIFGGAGGAAADVGLLLLLLVAVAFAPRRLWRMSWED